MDLCRPGKHLGPTSLDLSFLFCRMEIIGSWKESICKQIRRGWNMQKHAADVLELTLAAKLCPWCREQALFWPS